MVDDSNWYMLQVDDVDSLMRYLISEGIPCHDFRDTLKGTFIGFPSSFVYTVLRCIDRENDNYILEPSVIESTFKMIFISGIDYKKKPKENFEGWTYLVPVMERIYEIFGIRIIPDNPHGKSVNPKIVSGDDILYVNFWSAIEPTSNTKYWSVYDIVLENNQVDGLSPSSVGTGIKLQDNNGIIIAEYISNNLYILFDLPHAKNKNITHIFSKIMQSYLELCGKSPHDIDLFYKSFDVSDSESAREQFVKECGNLYTHHLEIIENQLRDYDKVIDEQNEKLVETIRERDMILVKLSPLKNSIEMQKQWAGNEFDTLMKIPHVKDILITGKTIHVWTDMISIDYNGNQYDIGEFRIDIVTAGSIGVKISNLTRTMGNLAHPHIGKDGSYCVTTTSLSKLLAEYQYVTLIKAIIDYLIKYDPKSAYGKIELWGNQIDAASVMRHA